MCKAKRLQAKIDQLQRDVAHVCSTHTTASAEVAKLQSEIFVAATQLAEITTRRIVWLTVILLFFTIALFAVEVRAVFFPQNPSAYPHTEQQAQHQQVVVPGITN